MNIELGLVITVLSMTLGLSAYFHNAIAKLREMINTDCNSAANQGRSLKVDIEVMKEKVESLDLKFTAWCKGNQELTDHRSHRFAEKNKEIVETISKIQESAQHEHGSLSGRIRDLENFLNKTTEFQIRWGDRSTH